MRALAMTGMVTACLDALDHLGVAHAGHAAVDTDVGGHTLERHDRTGPCVLGDLRLLGVDHVHDHTPLEHLREATLDQLGAGLVGARGRRGGVGGSHADSLPTRLCADRKRVQPATRGDGRNARRARRVPAVADPTPGPREEQ